MREVFLVFLRLGLSCFGGPIAHLGYFRNEFVLRRGWLDEAQFAQLLAICQVLPGPSSSQLGLAIGLQRAGWRGALAAFVGFTLPSAVLMFALAVAAPSLLHDSIGLAVLHGLKLVAVAVVAHGVWGMARTLTPDARRLIIAIACGALALYWRSPWSQPAAIAIGAVYGLLVCRPTALGSGQTLPLRYGARLGAAFAALFLAGLLAATLTLGRAEPTLTGLAATFYRAGALVFGGGHVVLPLLEQGLVAPGWLDLDRFLLGYGAAQAVPGPMFSLATYLGALTVDGASPVLGATVATIALFAPGFLLLIAALPLWSAWSQRIWAARAIGGVNAAVVGLLAAALYDPIWREGIGGSADILIVAIGLGLLAFARIHALWLVAWCVLAALVVQYGLPGS
jgi:chromate transporter